MKTVEQRAKAAALTYLNKARKDAKMEPLKRVTPLWWKMYGQEWVDIQVTKDKGSK